MLLVDYIISWWSKYEDHIVHNNIIKGKPMINRKEADVSQSHFIASNIFYCVNYRPGGTKLMWLTGLWSSSFMCSFLEFVFFLTMYIHRHTLLVLINITIQSWYTYKQHKTRRIQIGCTAVTYNRRNYQAQTFVVAREEEHLQLVHSMALKKPLFNRH
jgi:hypothetical protein